jgi:hypothetical protein
MRYIASPFPSLRRYCICVICVRRGAEQRRSKRRAATQERRGECRARETTSEPTTAEANEDNQRRRAHQVD